MAAFFQRKSPKTRCWWVRPVLQKRRNDGAYKIMVKNMEENDPELYFDYVRLSPEQFNEALSLVENDIKKEFTS
jgi:hypothetical protein